METVILAAGRGERLNGVAAPFHKPLLPVNGKPLVRNAVEIAATVAPETHPIVVVAPENAWPITRVLDGLPARLIIQREPRGPCDALLLGLDIVTSDNVLILMGDNVLTKRDVKNVTDQDAPSVGVRQLDGHEAERFTYMVNDTWVEKESISPDRYHAPFICWVGPLFVPVQETKDILLISHALDGRIGPPLLNGVNNGVLAFVDVDTYDIGTPEHWT